MKSYKIIKGIFLLGALGFLFTSFLPSTPNDVLFGKVKSVKTYRSAILAYGEAETFSSKIDYYNTYNNLDSTLVMEDSITYLSSRYFYTKKNKLDYVEFYSQNGEIHRVENYSYDKNDNLIVTETLDSEGKLRFENKYEYNSKNQLISKRAFQVIKDGHSSMYTNEGYIYADNQIRHAIDYLWNEDSITYNYDHFGNVVMELTKSITTENEKIIESTQLTYHDYVYDEKGNWISKKTYSLSSTRQGCLVFLETRKITYY